jgi:septum formation protein
MLYLASQSSYKRALLERLGVPFESLDVSVDESPLASEVPVELARRLALKKAKAGAEQSGSWTLGADQVIALGPTVFHKPGTAERAVDQLMALSGETHLLVSAVAVAHPDGTVAIEDSQYHMEMREFSREQAQAYVERDSPLDCAGAYKIEEAGIRLFRRMRGDDYTAIVGLPLTRVVNLLERIELLTGRSML